MLPLPRLLAALLLCPSAPLAALPPRGCLHRPPSRSFPGRRHPPAPGLIAAGGGGAGRGGAAPRELGLRVSPLRCARRRPCPPGTALATRPPGNRSDAESGLQSQIFTRRFPRVP